MLQLCLVIYNANKPVQNFDLIKKNQRYFNESKIFKLRLCQNTKFAVVAVWSCSIDLSLKVKDYFENK